MIISQFAGTAYENFQKGPCKVFFTSTMSMFQFQFNFKMSPPMCYKIELA
jgi:hypothetical protein